MTITESAAEQEQRRAVQTGLETLQVLKPRKNPFPIKSQVTINLIFSTASGVTVHEDFYRGLGGQRKYCTVTETRIRVTSADEIAEAVRNSSSDILVIVRGGGAETDFQPFNDKKVLEALSQNSSYRIVGIGHSNDTTLVDVIADYSASVPADAGVHIRDQLGNIRSLVVQFEQSLTQQEGELVRARTEIARLNESIQSNKKLVVAKQDKRRLWAIIIAIVLAGLYFSWQNPGVLTEILNVVPFSKGTG